MRIITYILTMLLLLACKNTCAVMQGALEIGVGHIGGWPYW